MKLMTATLRDFDAPDEVCQLFEHASSYLIRRESDSPSGLAKPWHAQLALDGAVTAIQAGDMEHAIALASQCNPNLLSGLLARMIRSSRPRLVEFANHEIRRNPQLVHQRFAGLTLLHIAAASGSVETVRMLLAVGADPKSEDAGRHTPLYSAANECRTAGGPEVVRILVDAGANVDAAAGVQRSTPEALIDCGAVIAARDRRGDTPLRRALNCRKPELAALLAART